MNTRAKITQVMRRAAIAVAAVAAFAAPASAATTARYAGVGGSTTDLSCTDPAHPCDLFHIIQSVGSPGDEVVVEPGTYEYAFAVDIARAMNIHGVAGQPRPVLHLAGLSASVLSASVTLRYLDLELGDGRLHVNGGTVEQVIVHGGDAACELGAPIVFRDNVCVQSSSTGSAIEVATNGGSEQVELRNVTAITNFDGGSAIHVGTQAAGGTVSVDLFNTIARVGGPKGTDLSATTFANGTATIYTNHSNYATAVHSGPGASINTSVTDTHAAPAFTQGSYHEAANSTATIGKGAVQADNGDFDFEGDLRSTAGATDIGADQFVSAPAISGVSAAGSGSTAAVHATLDTAGSPTTYTVQYGASAAYGSSVVADAVAASATPQAVAVPLTGLAPGATYHYRVVATGDGGPTASPDLSFTEAPAVVVPPAKPVPPIAAPVIGVLQFSHARFAVRSRSHRHGGTRISYTDTQHTRTTFTLSRRVAGRKARFVVVGSFGHSDVAGLNAVTFSGRLRGHGLKPGRYRIVAIPVNGAGKRGGARQHEFVVVG